jgi:hypothetical protein
MRTVLILRRLHELSAMFFLAAAAEAVCYEPWDLPASQLVRRLAFALESASCKVCVANLHWVHGPTTQSDPGFQDFSLGHSCEGIWSLWPCKLILSSHSVPSYGVNTRVIRYIRSTAEVVGHKFCGDVPGILAWPANPASGTFRFLFRVAKLSERASRNQHDKIPKNLKICQWLHNCVDTAHAIPPSCSRLFCTCFLAMNVPDHAGLLACNLVFMMKWWSETATHEDHFAEWILIGVEAKCQIPRRLDACDCLCNLRASFV